jgi:2,4-dienoyl-CoA reductase (NADPH2)
LGIEYQLPELKQPVSLPKRVLVVGGGLSGCEAARVAAERGHHVTLIERESRLGGLLWGQGAPRFKRREIDTLIAFYEAELEHLRVEVRLGTDATEELASDFDAILLATGTEPAAIPDGMYDAIAVLCSRELPPGNPVTVVGSSHYGSHAAAFALEQGRRTRFVAEPGLEEHIEDLNPLLAGHVYGYLTRLGIEFGEDPASVEEIDPEGGIVLWAPHHRTPSGALKHLVDGERVIEVGSRANTEGGLYVATQSGFWAGARI